MALQTFANGTLFGERYGQGDPTVLALHGWGRNRSDFSKVLDGLDAISLDLPGFGASPEPDSVWGAADYAASLQPVLAEFHVAPVVVGHSFGGRVATVLAGAQPNSVRSLILVGVPLLHRADRSVARPSVAFQMLRWLNDRGIVSDERMEQERRNRGSADYRAASGVMRDVLVRAVAETYEAELALVECPVRLIWGETDAEVPVSVAERAMSLLSDASLTVVADVGHQVPLNAPDRIRAILEELL